MRYVFIGLSGAVLLGGCASLLTASGSAADRWERLEKSRAAKQVADAGGDRQICKSMTVMGSNFPQRVCSTQAEWDAFNEQVRQSADDFDAQRRAGNTQGEYESGQR